MELYFINIKRKSVWFSQGGYWSMYKIYVETTKIDKNRIESRITVPNKYKKYFRSTEFFVEYDREITYKRSLLNIPIVSIILPVAWLTDAEIRVDSLDQRYLEMMKALREEMNKIYPAKKFGGEIKPENQYVNQIGAEGTALLFSGGVDSTYSLIKNWEKKPYLVMMWGIDAHIYPEYSDHWNELSEIYTNFAHQNGLDFSMVRTNACMILNNQRIEHDYYTILNSGLIRYSLQHSLISIPLTAPLSFGRFNEVLFAASLDYKSSFHIWPMGTIPSTDEKIVWADLSTKHDGFVTRIDKARAVADFMNEHELVLKVCVKPELNCCSCEKCYRTIMSLIVEGIDPNICGFKVTEETFQKMKHYFDKIKFREGGVEAYYTPLQRLIPDDASDYPYNSREFFEWFKALDFSARPLDVWPYRNIYNKLPYVLATRYERLVRLFKINILTASYPRKRRSQVQLETPRVDISEFSPPDLQETQPNITESQRRQVVNE